MISVRNCVVTAAFALTLWPLPPAAAATTPNAVGARVSPRGLAFIDQQVKRLVPAESSLPDFQHQLYNCPLTDNDPTLYVTSGRLALHIDQLQLTPQSGRLDGFVQLDAVVDADARITRAYACFGEANCHITANAQNLMIRASFAVQTNQGQPDVELDQIDLSIVPDDLHIDSSGCALGDFAVAILDVFKGWIIDQMTPRIEDMARSQIQPRLSEALQSLTARSGQVAGFDYAVALTGLTVDPEGIQALVDADVAWGGPPAACIPNLPEPTAGPAGQPTLAGHDDHLAIALARDLMNDALDAAWRSGKLCLSRKDMTGPLAQLLDRMPEQLEMPPGTTMDFELHAASPPSIALAAPGGGQPSEVTLGLDGMMLALDMRYPDGGSGHVEMSTGLSVTAHVGVDPATNALAFEIGDAKVARLDIAGSQGTILRMDPARVEQLIRDLLLPRLADQLSSLPLTAAVLHSDANSVLAGMYVLVNAIDGDDHYAYAFADLFAKPAEDAQPPETRFAETPPPLTHPGMTRFLFDGSDDLTPPRLLRFRTRVDGGDFGEPSFVHAVYAPATDGTHTLEVVAVDLNGNEDPVARRHSFVVDAMPPVIAWTATPPEIVNGRRFHVAFQGSDDRTPPDALRYRWKLRRLDPTTGVTETLDEQDFVAATDRFDVDTPGDGQFVLEVAVQDQAGNQTSVLAKFAVQGDGGCQAAPLSRTDPGAGFLALAGLGAAIALCRGRRRARG